MSSIFLWLVLKEENGEVVCVFSPRGNQTILHLHIVFNEKLFIKLHSGRTADEEK
jgi:hypothetical protein